MQGIVWKFKCGMFCVSYRLIISEGYKKFFSLDSSSLVSSGRLQEQTFNQDAWCPEPQASSVWALGPLGDVVQIPASGSHQVISFEAGDTNHELFSYTYIVYVCASYARYRVLIMLPILSLITVKICCLNGVWSLHDHRFLTRSSLIYNSLTSQHVCYFWSDGAILTADDELSLVSGFLGSSAFHHHLSSLSYPSYYEEHESGKEWFDI